MSRERPADAPESVSRMITSGTGFREPLEWLATAPAARGSAAPLPLQQVYHAWLANARPGCQEPKIEESDWEGASTDRRMRAHWESKPPSLPALSTT